MLADGVPSNDPAIDGYPREFVPGENEKGRGEDARVSERFPVLHQWIDRVARSLSLSGPEREEEERQGGRISQRGVEWRRVTAVSESSVCFPAHAACCFCFPLPSLTS